MIINHDRTLDLIFTLAALLYVCRATPPARPLLLKLWLLILFINILYSLSSRLDCCCRLSNCAVGGLQRTGVCHFCNKVGDQKRHQNSLFIFNKNI